jgi:hypothetical protein
MRIVRDRLHIGENSGQKGKTMLARFVWFWWATAVMAMPAGAFTWKCEGQEPHWALAWHDNSIELKLPSLVLRFKAVDAVRPNGVGLEHRIWIYETQALGTRVIPMTLVVQYTGRHAECGFSAAETGHRKHFSGLIIMPGRAFVGCCDLQSDLD